MDIIDIMMAKALSSSNSDAQASAEAQAAAAQAIEAAEQAENAINAVQSQLNNIPTKSEAVSMVYDAIEKLQVESESHNNEESITTDVVLHDKKSGRKTQARANKMYKQAGENEDGTMTQKAIKTYVDAHTSSGSTDLGSENSGNIVVVGDSGAPAAGEVTESELIELLIKNGSYIAHNAVGLEIDYENKEFNRIQQATGKSMGSDFDQFMMYGGRRRCTVHDDGTIDAFYGETGYREDNANLQVMIYQPKFYYQRIPLSTVDNRVGKIVKKDSIILSATPQAGFKLHPLFINEDGEEIDYVLLSAYEGGLYKTSTNGTYRYVTSIDFDNDKMVSLINTKPITGSSNLTLELAEKLAKNRGEGWHIFTAQAESANQMLELVEFGTLNGQTALGKGVTLVTSTGEYNCSALTGATTTLGNASGAAPLTYIEINSNVMQYSIEGKNSISYRGLENPWGNTWNMLGNITIGGSSEHNGGIPYICKSFNYSYANMSNEYESVGFSLPNNNGWISNLGYGDKDYDWVLMPAAISDDANSVLPIGDRGWFTTNLSGIRMVVSGGSWGFEDADGPFYYGCDKMPTDSKYKSYGARLMFIPTKNAIYNANINKWQHEVGE